MKKQLGRQTSLVNLELCQKSTTHPDRHHPVAIMDLIRGHLQQGYFEYFAKKNFVILKHNARQNYTTLKIHLFSFFRPTDPQNVNHQQKLNSSSQYNTKPPASNSLEPCIEPVNDNTTGVPTHLSPSLSTASSAYFPQNSYTSASHSYYSTAEDNQIEEAKTSEGT